MQAVVGVKYKQAGKVYYFDRAGLTLSKGDKVIVDSAGGLSLGEVSDENKLVEASEIEEPLKKVIRIATEEDLKKYNELKEKAISKLPIIEEKITSLGLQMNLVEAEYSLDETKITISYTSDGRVDFRELLKVLASTLRVKIELRQIGTRDEVKIIGGLGLCGMPCCCTRFLKEPEHVTVKMVKNQNLSMNPTKTGGLCGRMMCCLAFEDKQYKEMLSLLPSQGSFITMPNGTAGTVVSVDVLGQKFTLKIASQDGSYKLKEFSGSDLKCPKEAPNASSEQEEKQEQKQEQKQEEKEIVEQEQTTEKPKQEKQFNKKHKKYFKNHKKEKK